MSCRAETFREINCAGSKKKVLKEKTVANFSFLSKYI